ncbi:MAG: hypothetical protein AAGD05_18845, partial [Bacteroidota bacterium]
AYVLNEIGKVKLYIQDLQTGDRELILKYGSRNAFQATDYNYPRIAWNPNNLDLGIIYEKRDISTSFLYYLASKKSVTDVLPNQLQRIYSMDYINASKMVFSAAVRGISDIYTYIPVTRQFQQITNDFWDDLDASFVRLDGRKGILFASNRRDSMVQVSEKLDSILPIDNFDIFYYDLEDNSRELVRITNTPNADERHPIGIDSTWFTYTTDQSGIFNRQMGFLEEYLAFYEQVILLTDGSEVILHQDSSLAKLDSTLIDSVSLRPVYKKRAINHNSSNYFRNIQEQHVSLRRNKLVELVDADCKQHLMVKTIDTDSIIMATPTRFREQGRLLSNTPTTSFLPPTPIPTPTPAIDELILFENQFDDIPAIVLEEQIPTPSDTIPPKPAKEQPAEKVDIDNYLFQSEFDDEEIPSTIVKDEEVGTQVIEPTTPTPVISQAPISRNFGGRTHKF